MTTNDEYRCSCGHYFDSHCVEYTDDGYLVHDMYCEECSCPDYNYTEREET